MANMIPMNLLMAQEAPAPDQAMTAKPSLWYRSP
jgi:hypothetical protein